MHRALTEWPLLPARLVRTRLGVRVLLLAGALWWLQRGDPAADPVGIAVLAGALGAVVCADGLAASKADRAALAHRLLHPTSPAAIAAGRWLGAVSGAALLVLAFAAVPAWSMQAPGVAVEAALAGIVSAIAVSACALALAFAGGHGAAVLVFLWLLVVSPLTPETVLAAGRHGIVSVLAAAALEIGPSVWRYRNIATGELGAAAHAAIWAGVGFTFAAWRVARLGGRPL